MRSRDPGAVPFADDRQRSRRLRARYRERASKLRARAMAMISNDTRQVMLCIADYFQQMADRLETSGRAAKAAMTSGKPTKAD
jgi:hypothetical protein